MEIGLYIHIPFCTSRCNYCDFCTTVSPKNREAYLPALEKELMLWREKLPSDRVLSSIYFGGGTPTTLPEEELAHFLEKVGRLFPIKEGAEISMEANPESVNVRKLEILREAGINRLSFGMQSAVEHELLLLGRRHSLKEVQEAIENARKAGFDDISLDMMLGIPEQTEESLKQSLAFVLSQPITHISAYMLKLEENTVLYKKAATYHFPDEDETADMYMVLVNALEKAGFLQYEISNFAKEGKVSRHNLSYWEQKPYLGLGPGAHSYLNGKRFYFPEQIGGFIEHAGTGTFYERESVEGLWEYLMLRLRLTEGILFAETEGKYPEFSTDFPKLVENSGPLVKDGLCVLEKERLFLTPRGFLVNNQATLYLLNGIGET